MASRYDAIVIGGGHNGLVNAAYLARAGQEGARPRAPPRAGRRRRDRGGLPRLPVLGLLVRGLAAAAGDHPRAGPAAPRPRDPAPRRHLHAHAERRLPVAHERPRAHAARDLPPLAHSTPRPTTSTRRRWWTWRASSSRSSPWCRPTRCRFDVPGFARLCGLGRRFQALPRDRPAQPDPAHDHERGGPARPVVRDRRAEGHHVGQRDHRHLPGRALAGHRLRAAAPLHGRDRRRVPLLGLLARRHGRHQHGHRGRGARRRGSRSAPSASIERIKVQGRPRDGRGAGGRRGDRRRRGRLQRRPAPHVPEADASPACSTTTSWPRCGATSCAARRARSTSPSTGCPTSRACPARARTCAAPSPSRPASSTWSGPTTTPSTATSRGGRTSTW